MTNTSTLTAAATPIQKVLDEWAEAHRVKSVERVIAICAADMVQFIMAPPLQFKGATAWDLKSWFATFDGPILYEIHDLQIAPGEDTAFCHFLNHLGATQKEYGKFDMWNRATLGFQKVRGEWKITHSHSSVPFYMDGSFKAAVDLKP